MFDYLVCPNCRNRLKEKSGKLVCVSCEKQFSISDGIPDFREKDEYWCNVSREKMKYLNDLAKETGNWLESAYKVIPQYAPHFIPFHRADSQFLWPSTRDSKILDAGSMWGGISIPAAQFHKEVYAVDKTKETLEFLKIRAAQQGFSNIKTVVSGLQRLPFSDNYFDLVILNGVLEWVAYDNEVVLEKNWSGLGRGLRQERKINYKVNPRDIQLNVLKELNRVLKPGGSICLAIENRIGYIYLLGYPDNHMNLPFIGILPRFLASMLSKLILKSDYRTYVYSIPGYKSLLKQGGFKAVYFYGVFMHYISSKEVIPLELIKHLKEIIIFTKRRVNKLSLRLIPKSILKYVCPSIIAFGVKGKSEPNYEPRLIQVIRKAGLLTNEIKHPKIVKCDSRPGNDLTVNYLIYDGIKDVPKYFCKVCRGKDSTEVLDVESENLKNVAKLLKDTELEKNIPQLVYYGTIDEITFLVTEFFQGKVYQAKPAPIKWRLPLREMDKRVKLSIELLVKFQKLTFIKNVPVVPNLVKSVIKNRDKLERKGHLSNYLKMNINKVLVDLECLKDIEIPMCAVHRDYNLCNVMFRNGEKTILDFEHFVMEGFPFLDLANITFNSLLMTYGNDVDIVPFYKIVRKYKLKRYLHEWLTLYSQLSGISMEILKFLGLIAGLEQRSIDYPQYRDPNTNPLYREQIFQDLVTWRL